MIDAGCSMLELRVLRYPDFNCFALPRILVVWASILAKMPLSIWRSQTLHALQTEIERRWRVMFVALEAGDDVPPSQRLRAEGMMEAAVLLGIATPDALVEAMDSCYRIVFGCAIHETCGKDWQAFFPFPQIPAMSKRAPVYPSTRD